MRQWLFSTVEWSGGVFTFWKESSPAIAQMLAQEPTVAKVVIAFYELYAIALCQTQFIAAPSDKVVDDEQSGADWGGLRYATSGRHVRERRRHARGRDAVQVARGGSAQIRMGW